MQGARARMSQAMDRVGEKRASLGDAAGKVGDRAVLAAGEQLAGAMSQAARSKEVAKAHLLDVSLPVRQSVLRNLREMVKNLATADPDMWRCVKAGIRSAVNTIWIDIEHEVDRNLEVALLKQQESQDMEGPEASRLCCCALAFRACVLHHFLPHDRSIFGKLKDPIFLLVMVLTMLPIHGIRVAIFSLLLVMHLFPRPPDEFQLINFILQFKGTQFFTSGILTMCIGAIQYFVCYTREKDALLACIDTKGPGSFESLTGECVDYLGSILLVWVAFCALPCSEKKSQNSFTVSRRADQDAEDGTVCCCISGSRTRGGRLRNLLYYDIFCFAISLAILIPLTWFSDRAALTGDNIFSDLFASPQVRANVFWCKVLYALLSFPFAVFIIPVLQTILTHSNPTGYNEHGACVLFALPPSGKKPGQEEDSCSSDEDDTSSLDDDDL